MNSCRHIIIECYLHFLIMKSCRHHARSYRALLYTLETFARVKMGKQGFRSMQQVTKLKKLPN